MYKQISHIFILVLLFGTFINSSIVAQQLSGDVSIGYVLTNDDNNQSLIQERYNYYEGAAVSLNNFSLTNNGIFYTADLNNFTMNNRNLWFSVYKPSKFTISAKHNKYRRIYDANEAYSTKRDLTDITADLMINRNITLFGSFTNHQNKGKRLFVADIDSMFTLVDYSSQVASGGVNYSSSIGSLTAQYSYTNYNDEVDSLYIQKTNLINISGTLVIPGFEKYRLYGGVVYQQNQLDELNFNQNNYHGWAGTKIWLPKKYQFEYRFLYNRTSHEARERETDTWHHLVSIAKNWRAKYGLRVGLDYVISDDLLNKTKRSGVLVNGWAHPNKALYLKVETNYYDKSTDYGNTSFGDNTYNRNKFFISYTATERLTLTGDYLSRFREDEQIDSKVDYGKYAVNLTYNDQNLGKLSGTFSYASGDYKNQSETTSYEFSNYYINGSIAPKVMDKVSLIAYTTYYKLDKNQDYQKVILSGLLGYQFNKNWNINIVVNQFNVEDKLLNDEYDGYVIAFNLVNHFEK